MRRREFITLLGGAAAVWPVAARAQQASMPVLGFLYAGSPEPIAHLVAAFRAGLSEVGYVEGRNVSIEFRWAHNQSDRLPDLANDLITRRVAAIVAPGSLLGPIAAKAATTSIPIVFSMGGDPVELGLVSSFNRPGGNVTGIISMNVDLGSKRLGLLHELLPTARRFALLASVSPFTNPLVRDVQAGASTLGAEVEIICAATNGDIDTAFAVTRQKQIDALVIAPGPLFNNNRVQLAILAARYAMPTIYSSREFTEAGGLMSYGPSITEEFRQAGIYAGRVLKGEKPADMPVMRSTKFEFVINLKTAKALGLEVAPALLARVDEVIE
jgi:putative tryptophan/tyrosine transport system substrate-binding protein